MLTIPRIGRTNDTIKTTVWKMIDGTEPTHWDARCANVCNFSIAPSITKPLVFCEGLTVLHEHGCPILVWAMDDLQFLVVLLGQSYEPNKNDGWGNRNHADYEKCFHVLSGLQQVYTLFWLWNRADLHRHLRWLSQHVYVAYPEWTSRQALQVFQTASLLSLWQCR